MLIGRIDVEAETPILWPPDAKKLTHLKRLWCWERLKAGGDGDNRGWDGWMASLTQWTGVWINSGRWWWTGMSSVLWSTWSQRFRHDWVTELNWNVSHPQKHPISDATWNKIMIIIYIYIYFKQKQRVTRCKGIKCAYLPNFFCSLQVGYISQAGFLPKLPGLAIQFLLLFCGKWPYQCSVKNLSLHSRIIIDNRWGYGTLFLHF